MKASNLVRDSSIVYARPSGPAPKRDTEALGFARMSHVLYVTETYLRQSYRKIVIEF